MKPVWMLGALLVFTSIGCDVFLPDVGGEGQECSTADTCRGDLNCREGVCCRNHWVDRDDNCGTCPGNWDQTQDCADCLGPVRNDALKIAANIVLSALGPGAGVKPAKPVSPEHQ